MTALDKYVRLESGGLWRADATAQRRDVTVSFGDATLVITDGAGRPLAHWSLPAIRRQNPDTRPAIFAPDEAADETLEVSDALMIEAIEQVMGALEKERPKPGKLRHLTTAAIIALVLALAIFWLPGALTRQTLAVVPASKRIEIGAEMLAYIQQDTGAACRESAGLEAADALMERLLGAAHGNRLVVLPALAGGAATLPGGIVLLDRALLEQTDDPAVAAGYLLAARVARAETDPLAPVLESAGLGTTFRLLTTGDIPAPILQEHAGTILADRAPSPNGDALAAAFVAAQVASGPYYAMADARGDNIAQSDGPSIDGTDMPLILADDDWVSLQNICNV